MSSTVDLIATLKTHFGYEQFRPLQEEIIRDALAGRDVFVLMPTGGGKSLCFQLPALMREGLTIVVSPLISLMKDQVDALQTSGIPATYLNSTLDREEANALARPASGEYRMLYVAPERLMLETFLERALNWNIAQFAIDEALHQRMGTRFPAGIPRAQEIADTSSRSADDGACDGHRTGADGHHQGTETARRALFHREL